MRNLDTAVLLPTEALSSQVWHKLRARMSGPHSCITPETQTALQEHQNIDRTLRQNTHLDDPLHQDPNNIPFTMKELLPVIRSLPTGKSPGLDDLPYELLRVGASILAPRLLQIINKLWETETMPDAWTTSLMRMVHKRNDPQDARNWRGIVLISGLAKVYEALLRKRIVEHTENNHTLSYHQFGYRAHNSATEAIYTLTQAIKSGIQQSSNRHSPAL